MEQKKKKRIQIQHKENQKHNQENPHAGAEVLAQLYQVVFILKPSGFGAVIKRRGADENQLTQPF
jgi:hypothetical protein